ncbi:MAG: hypothetical protein ABL970_16370 [Nitrospira sp.]
MSVAAASQLSPSNLFQTPAPNTAGAQRLDTKVSAISTATDLTGQLSVTTAEGDKITLTADFEARYRAVSYQGQAQTENGTVNVSAKSIEATLKQQFGVTVEGDLNPQELSDLEKLFKKVGSIFSKFFSGQDDEALAKTAKLADKFGGLSSLSSLDLSVSVERSVTVLAAQVASDVTGQPALPANQTPAATTSPATDTTPGAAPSTAAAIPQTSTGTTAPTQPSTDATASAADSTVHLVAPAPEASQPKSLVQQVLDAFNETKVEPEKVRKYLPDFLKKLRENLGRELHGERPHHGHEPEQQVAATTPDAAAAPDQASSQTPNPTPTQAPASFSVAVLAYQSFSRSSITLSVHS